MINQKLWCAAWLVSGLLWACGNATSDGNDGSDRAMAEALGEAVMHTNLSEVTPLTVEELETWMPETLIGLPLESARPGSMSKRGISGIHGNYGDPGDKRVVVTVRSEERRVGKEW